MHDGAAVRRTVHQRDVLLDAVEGLHLEAPPVGPQRAAHAFLRQPVGQLVGLHAVVECGHLEAELLRQVEHRRHLVGAVAVDVHQDLAIDRTRQRVQLQIALAAAVAATVRPVVAGGALPPALLLRLLRLGRVLLQVFAGIDEGRAVTRHVAHARGRAALAAVHPLGVLAAGHLQTPGRTGKLHALVGGGRHVLQRHATAADQVGRAGQDLQRGHAAGQCGVEARILCPDGMLGPDICRHRRGHLVAVAVRLHARAGIHAQVRVHVDQAGRHPLAGRVDAGGAFGRGQAPADRRDLAVGQQHVGAIEAFPGAGQHRRVGQQHRRGRDGAVGAGVRVLGEAGGGRGGHRAPAQRGQYQPGQQGRSHRVFPWKRPET